MTKIITVEIEVSDVTTEYELAKELTRVVGRSSFVKEFYLIAAPPLEEIVSENKFIPDWEEENDGI